MKCSCGGNINVTNTTEYDGMIFRKRRCVECGATLTTREYVVPDEHPVVAKAFKLRSRRNADSARESHKRWVAKNPNYFKEYRIKNTSKVRKEED